MKSLLSNCVCDNNYQWIYSRKKCLSEILGTQTEFDHFSANFDVAIISFSIKMFLSYKIWQTFSINPFSTSIIWNMFAEISWLFFCESSLKKSVSHKISLWNESAKMSIVEALLLF